MKRIAIMGCPGSGKSTLARELGAELGLPVHHLDRYYWQPGWVEADAASFASKLKELFCLDEWIIDGGYNGHDPDGLRFKRAELIIYFDRSVWLCLYRAIKRVFQYRNKTRPDMGPDCPEKMDLEFLLFIWNYRRKSWHKLMDRAVLHGHVPVILKTDPNVPELAAMIRALSVSSQTSHANP